MVVLRAAAPSSPIQVWSAASGGSGARPGAGGGRDGPISSPIAESIAQSRAEPGITHEPTELTATSAPTV